MTQWILIKDDLTHFTYKCSECGCIIHIERKRDIPYGCPNCGIELDVDGD